MNKIKLQQQGAKSNTHYPNQVNLTAFWCRPKQYFQHFKDRERESTFRNTSIELPRYTYLPILNLYLEEIQKLAANNKAYFLDHFSEKSDVNAWYLYQRVTHSMQRKHEGKQVYSDKKYLIITALYRSNNRDCSLRLHLFMSYHLM